MVKVIARLPVAPAHSESSIDYSVCNLRHPCYFSNQCEMGTAALVRNIRQYFLTNAKPSDEILIFIANQIRNQWDLLEEILSHYWSPGPRFAVALCAFTWAFYFLGVNVSSNMLPFGSDSTMLLPRFLTIPRGQLLALLLSWPLVPWKIEASATIFVQFLSGYGIFMVCNYTVNFTETSVDANVHPSQASVAACMMCECKF